MNKSLIIKKVRTIWHKIYHVENSNDNIPYYHFNNSSLKSIELISEVYKVFHIKVTIKQLNEYFNILLLSDFINTEIMNIEKKSKKLPTLKYIKNEVSNAQKRILLSSKITFNHFPYNLLFGFEIKGNLVVDNAIKAFKCIIKKYEPLRTIYQYNNESFLQVVKKFEDCNFTVTEYNFSNQNQHIRDHGLRTIIYNENNYRFNLSEEIPFRACIIKLALDNFYIILNIHHICVDLESISLILDNFKKYYYLLTEIDDIDSYIKNIEEKSYIPFVINKKEQLKSGELNSQKRYWNQLYKKDFVRTKILSDINNSNPKMHSGSVYNLNIRKNLFNFLNLISSENKELSLFVRIYITIVLLIYKITNNTDIIIIIPVLDRKYEVYNDCVGLYLNTLPIRTTFNSNFTIAELINVAYDAYLGLQTNSEYPFDLIVKNTTHKNNLFEFPFSNIMLAFVEQSKNYYLFKMNEDLEIKLSKTHDESSKNDLSFFFYEESELMNLRIEYNNTKFSEKYIIEISNKYKALIKYLNEQKVNINKIKIKEINLTS